MTIAPLAAPLTDAENIAKAFTTFLGLLAIVLAVSRFVFRPLFDEIVFGSWKRKVSDVKAHMVETMFKDEIAKGAAMREDVAKALQLSMACTAQIAAIGEQVHAGASLLAGIPALDVRLEGLDDRMGEMITQIARANDTAERNGRIIAAHSAILGERRNVARRVGDAPPAIDDGDDIGGIAG